MTGFAYPGTPRPKRVSARVPPHMLQYPPANYMQPRCRRALATAPGERFTVSGLTFEQNAKGYFCCCTPGSRLVVLRPEDREALRNELEFADSAEIGRAHV